MMQRCRLKAERKNGLSATVSARALNVDGVSFAGLWSRWRDIETDEEVLSATIIVTNANETLRPIHDRMPVILEPESFQPWLSGQSGTELLVPAAEEKLTSWPVSTRVNKTGSADDASLIVAVN